MSPSAILDSMKNPFSASKNPLALATKAPYMDATREKRVAKEAQAGRDAVLQDENAQTAQMQAEAQAIRDQAARRRRTLIGGQ